jgi:hypothetical protein
MYLGKEKRSMTKYKIKIQQKQLQNEQNTR